MLSLQQKKILKKIEQLSKDLELLRAECATLKEKSKHVMQNTAKRRDQTKMDSVRKLLGLT